MSRLGTHRTNFQHGRDGGFARGRVGAGAARSLTLIALFATSLAVPSALQASVSSCERWVAPNGSDNDEGSQSRPWGTLQHAVEQVPDGGCVIAVQPGVYQGATITRRFGAETIIRSAVPHAAMFVGSSRIINVQGGAHVTLEGFVITQSGTIGNNVLVNVEDLSGVEATHVSIRNNIIHDAFDNDLLKIRSGARYVTVEGNVFYNPSPAEQHIDVNGVRDIVIQDNLFFNDYVGSGRSIPGTTKAFIVVKDSSGTGELGSRRVAIRRNVFMNWQGGNEPFLQIGNDGKPYHEAVGVTIENNLLLGNSPIAANTALGVAGARDVYFVNNTVVGDLPSTQYAGRFVLKGDNPPNLNIVLANNIYSDHTGTMGRLTGGDTPGEVSLHNNLYWNGGKAIGDHPGVSDDQRGIVANPLLPTNHSVVLPRWTGSSFVSGASTIDQEFVRIVQSYAITGALSPAADRADPLRAPVEDILGRPRGSSPDIGAWESNGTSMPPTTTTLPRTVPPFVAATSAMAVRLDNAGFGD